MAHHWTFTSHTDTEFDFDGQHYVMQPTDTFSADDACKMKAFLATWHQAIVRGVAENSPGALQVLDESCPASSAPPDLGPAVPPTQHNQSAGVNDSPPPAATKRPRSFRLGHTRPTLLSKTLQEETGNRINFGCPSSMSINTTPCRTTECAISSKNRG